MEVSEIWIGIIIPIIIGPIFVYLKSIRDEVVERRYRRAREKYEEKRDTIYNELKLFYWPVYINLLCIEQYSYSLPIKNKFRYESKSSLGEYNSNNSESDDYYPSDKSSNLSSHTNLPKKSVLNLDEPTSVMSIHDLNDIVSDNVEITIPMNENIINENINMDIRSISNQSSVSSIIKKKKTLILDKITLKKLEENLNEKYNETIEIIEKNMALVCIHQQLNLEMIKFIKYAKVREIIEEGSPNREYNIEYFGVENNIDKFIIETKKILLTLNTNYTTLLNNPI
jgi:hypothetical protein